MGHRQVKHIILLAIAAVALGGCVTTGANTLSASSTAAICEAVGPPHEYNSTNKNSTRHAGTRLSPRLARDNRVGKYLHCPGY
jgi:hypothetical protein